MATSSTIPTPTELSMGPSRKIKKKRLPGACDECRRKKAKCDSAQMPGNSCTNCASFDIQCTHNFPRRRQKTEPEPETSLQMLQARIEKLEDFIRRLYPGEDIEFIINMAPEETPIPSTGSTRNNNVYTVPRYSIPQSISPVVPPANLPAQDHSGIPDEDDLAHVALAEHLGRLAVNATDDRYFGPASAFMFAKHASTVRCEVMGKPNNGPEPMKYRRPIYWDIRPWEMAYATSPEPPYVYPDHDLLLSLVAYYFENSNNLIPVVHRPSFMKSLSCGQHHWDPAFGMTVLLVCALGSRYSKDARVRVANDDTGLSAGWNYFSQVPYHRKLMFYKSSIYDLQYYALAAMYLVGSCIPNAAWHILGIGLRHALEKGVHRRMGHSQRPSVESELQKRAFWALVCLDRLGCSFVGRPSGYPHEAFDVEYPIECDDEYWETEDPEKAFQQPPGKPCSLTAFISFIKLCEILSFVLRTLYTNKKSRIQSGFIGNEWEMRMVAELDSSMNKWKDSLPDYLRWDPKQQDSLFFKQSVNLHATYYHVQIQIHRQFLTKQSALSFASLAVCTNAARSCAHVLEIAGTRDLFVLPNILTSAFTAGIVIALNLWGIQRSGYISDAEEEIKNFNKCVNFLAKCDKRWNQAGRLCDMLKEVGSMESYEPTTRKRRRSTSSISDGVFSPKRPEREPFVQTFVPVGNITGYPVTLQDELGDRDLHGLMSATSTHPHAGTSQVPDFPSGNDMFALWSDIPTAFNSFEEWEAYLTRMGQS